MAIIGIDLGGTKVVAALFDNIGNIILKEHRLLDGREGDEVGRLLMEIIETIMTGAETLKLTDGKSVKIESIGICIPGIVYSKTGIVWAPNIPGWDNYPLKSVIEDFLPDKSVKIVLESDRTCYILGEVWRGAAKDCENAIYLAVGTGIGAGILIDGHILHGANDIVGATGWMALKHPYEPEYIPCGCLEYYASGNGIATQIHRELRSEKNYNGILSSMPIERVTSHHVFDAFDKGDLLSRRVLDRAIEMWGMASANLVSLFNPEIVIFGGGVFGPAAQFIDRIYNEACKWGQPISMKDVKFTITELKGDAALYGAGCLALRSIV